MNREVSGQGPWVYFCADCYTRFKLRSSPQGAEVVWIILDRSLYQSRDLVTVYPLLSQTVEDIRCPICGTDCLKRIEPAAPAPAAPPEHREAILAP